MERDSFERLLKAYTLSNPFRPFFGLSLLGGARLYAVYSFRMRSYFWACNCRAFQPRWYPDDN